MARIFIGADLRLIVGLRNRAHHVVCQPIHLDDLRARQRWKALDLYHAVLAMELAAKWIDGALDDAIAQ